MDTATTERCIQPPITGSCPGRCYTGNSCSIQWRLVLHQMDLLTTPHVGCKHCPLPEQTKTSEKWHEFVLWNAERLLILVQIPTGLFAMLEMPDSLLRLLHHSFDGRLRKQSVANRQLQSMRHAANIGDVSPTHSTDHISGVISEISHTGMHANYSLLYTWRCIGLVLKNIHVFD